MTKPLRDKTRRCFVSSARRSQSKDGRLLLFVLLVFPGLFTGLLTVLYFGSDQQTAVFNAAEDIIGDEDVETGSGDLLVGKDIGYPELDEVACYYMTAK